MGKREAWLREQEKAVSARDLDLLKRASGILEENICSAETDPWYPFRCVCPFGGTKDVGIWNWDSAFHAIGISHWDMALAEEQILGFIPFQLENGMYIDMIRRSGKKNEISTKPPVMAWAAAELYKTSGNLSFVEKVYESLCKNEAFWRRERFYKGLFHYGADMNLVKFEDLDLYVKYESGWDNSPRWDKPCSDYDPIDLNCFAVMMYRGLVTLAGALGKAEDAKDFREKERVLTEKILTSLWNEELAVYTDRNRFTGEMSPVLTPASFMPLYIGIAPSDRAKALAVYAADPETFYPGMPTVSYDNPAFSLDYWRGNTWLNVAYFAAKGLLDYGYIETARGICETILGWVERDGDCIHENYDSKTGKGLYNSRFSWSCVFVIEMILHM